MDTGSRPLLAALLLLTPAALAAQEAPPLEPGEVRQALERQQVEPLACPLPARPAPARARGARGQGAVLAMRTAGHRVAIPPAAIREEDGEVTFELAHLWDPDEENQILLVAANRVAGDGERTGYRFAAPVRVRISWARCGVQPERVRVLKTVDGGRSWREIGVHVPRRGRPFVEFEDDSFSGYVVAG